MKLGILVPLAQELKPLTNRPINWGTFVNISDKILICRTGVGRANTERAVQQMLSFGVDQLIGWGTAAGLSPAALEGDLLIPDAVIIENKRYPTNQKFNVDFLRVVPKKIRWHKGLIYATDNFLDSIESKQELFAKTRCLGADMESGALAMVATENNTPFSVIRTVSDPVSMGLPKSVLAGFSTSGDFLTNNFIKSLLSRPADWIATIKLAKNFKKAQKTLNIVAQILKDQEWT